MRNKHFLDVGSLSVEELQSYLDLAATLKSQWNQGGNDPILAGKTLGMLFMKPSLRTRVSFEMAMRHLGGEALYLSPSEVGLGKRESVADVARVLSRYVDAIMARVFEHTHILELAANSQVPVINGLSDFSHPCQALGDLFTIREHKGSIRGVSIAYIGDGNNVAISLMQGASKLGANVVIGAPQGYQIEEVVLAQARADATASGGTVRQIADPLEAVKQADVIYTDVWTSMGQEAERDQRLLVFPPYQINQALVEAASNPEVIVMHCLPAHRGEEITDAVADGPHSVLWDQAENRMHAQKGILALLLS